jgi:hypothetical protein
MCPWDWTRHERNDVGEQNVVWWGSLGILGGTEILSGTSDNKIELAKNEIIAALADRISNADEVLGDGGAGLNNIQVKKHTRWKGDSTTAVDNCLRRRVVNGRGEIRHMRPIGNKIHGAIMTDQSAGTDAMPDKVGLVRTTGGGGAGGNLVDGDGHTDEFNDEEELAQFDDACVVLERKRSRHSTVSKAATRPSNREFDGGRRDGTRRRISEITADSSSRETSGRNFVRHGMN